MKIALGSDHAGVDYKKAIAEHLRGKGIGGEALKLLAEHYDELPLALDIPAVLPGTEGAKSEGDCGGDAYPGCRISTG